jgi:zinc resistance-associated protein
MRQKQAFKRGRAVSVLAAGGIGYLVGSWNAVTPHNANTTAAQAVALRFPQNSQHASVAASAKNEMRVAPATASAMVLGSAQLALLSPEPMVPQQPAPQAAVQTAAMETVTQTPAADVRVPTTPSPAPSAAKPVAAVHHANRPGFVLDDAQIARIKERLHLTQDQEQMWPAVEAALRNLAYMRAQEAHRGGGHANEAQLAYADANSTEVEDLKSAALPLLMSFNAEQKDEVRSLAHVMGLDQLASQF